MKTSKLTASYTEVSDTFTGLSPSKKRTAVIDPNDFDEDEDEDELEIDLDEDLASLDELAVDDEDDDF